MIFHGGVKPKRPKEGDTYFDSAAGFFKIYDNGFWVTFQVGSKQPCQMQEAIDLLANPEFDPMLFIIEAYAYLLDNTTDCHPVRQYLG